jgi:16S rRNA (cytosine967-C5)-methyltransferase
MDLLRCALPLPADPAYLERLRRPFLRDAALQALEVARSAPSYAVPALSRWFRQTRSLGSKDRPVVVDAVYGIIRHESLLLEAGAQSDRELFEGWCRILAGDLFPELGPGEETESDYATALSLPRTIAGEWLRRWGPEQAAALAQALNSRAPLTIRANLLHCKPTELADRLAAEGVLTRPCARALDGLIVDGRVNLLELESFQEGWFEVQDESSQLLVESIPLYVGQRLVDLCAGAGGKSLALAARGARVEAWDPRTDALQRLRERARRAGLSVTVREPRPAPVVLVDAPCSGSGRLRRDPPLRWNLNPEAHLQAQRTLLAEGAELVEPGGILVYATCSLIAVENQLDIPTELGRFELIDEVTLWPHRDGTGGFGWRIWRRS